MLSRYQDLSRGLRPNKGNPLFIIVIFPLILELLKGVGTYSQELVLSDFAGRKGNFSAWVAVSFIRKEVKLEMAEINKDAAVKGKQSALLRGGNDL